MLFKSLLLVNFGVHKRLEFAPSPGLTLVIGPNGAGKSTVIASQEFVITGNVPTAGTKEMNVCPLAGPGEASYVTALVEHNGHTLNITRGLKRAKTTLVVDGGTVIEGESKVNAEINQILGVASSLLADYVFVKQDAIYGFLDATEATRSKAFSQLFGTVKAEKLWTMIGKRLETVQAPPPSVDLDAARRRLADDREALVQAKRKRKRYKDLDGYDPNTDPDSAVVARYTAYKAARVEAKAAETAMDEADALRIAATATLEGMRTKRDALQDAITGIVPNAEAARTALATWKAYTRWSDAAEAIERRGALLVNEKEANPKPEPPECYLASGDEIRNQLISDKKRSAKNDEAFLATFKAGVAKCPTCGTPASNLDAVIAEAKTRLPETKAAVIKAEFKLALDRAYEQKLAVWKQWNKGYKEKVLRHNEEVEASEDELTAPVQTEVELKGVVAQYKEVKEAFDQAETACNSAAALLSRLEGRFEAAFDRLVAAKKSRKLTRTSREEYKAAKVSLRRTTARLHTRGELAGEISALSKSVVAGETAVDAAEAIEAGAAASRKLAARLEAMRTILHRSNLPRLTARGYMSLIEGGINSLLGRFGAEFRVESGDDLAYTASFHTGKKEGTRSPATRLSFGEKVLLAVAFRVEVNSLFAGEIGLLCLDEPTQFLDADNVRCLEHAITQLKNLSAAKGLQCVLVTHEKLLGRLSDITLEL